MLVTSMLASFVMLVIFSMYPTSQTCHQHIWSPTSVTNIDVANFEVDFRTVLGQKFLEVPLNGTTCLIIEKSASHELQQ